MKINSHNEWDPLREILVGTAESIACLSFSAPAPIDQGKLEAAYKLAREAYPQSLIDAINEDLEELCGVLRKFGVKIYRPNTCDINKYYSTPNWGAVGNNLFNMRDLHLVVGDAVIESPSPSRHRLFEATGLYDIWYEYFKEGFRWICGPKPRLVGEYEIPFYEGDKRYIKLSEDEILFDAANTVRMGKDLLYLVSASGNYAGAKWLQAVLGNEYRVHTTEEIYRSSHIDSTVLCLRPGLVLLNGYRVNPKNCPEILNKWDKIYFNDILPFPQEILDFQKNVREPVYHRLKTIGVESNIHDMSSEWIGMNILSIDPDHVIVDKRQEALIRVIEKSGATVIPINFRYSYFMGGIHCNTLDTVRDSKLEDYFA
ncbi:MAG: hypothetical protein ABH885_05940 [Candidatus Omnitrophota bacterium]